MESIALGGAVRLPYQSGPPERGSPIPTLRNEHVLGVEEGGVLRAGLRLIGPLAGTLPGIIEGIARQGLDLGGTRFALRAAHDGIGRVLYDRRFPGVPAQMPTLMRLSAEPERARRVRIVFETPARLQLDRKGTSFDPAEVAKRFFEHSLARAVQVHHGLMGLPRVPWMESPVKCWVAGHRLFQYLLPRRSYRQDKRLDFDGVVGYLDLEGELDAGIPYARAAEVLHWGGKAAFGLGKVRVLVLE